MKQQKEDGGMIRPEQGDLLDAVVEGCPDHARCQTGGQRQQEPLDHSHHPIIVIVHFSFHTFFIHNRESIPQITDPWYNK